MKKKCYFVTGVSLPVTCIQEVWQTGEVFPPGEIIKGIKPQSKLWTHISAAGCGEPARRFTLAG